ncbi:MAG: amidohydrolase family protein, partial [Candidatus Limnocylindrales bacterium]
MSDGSGTATGSFALRAASVLEPATGIAVVPGWIVVADGRISAVEGRAPAAIETIDLGEVTLLPGLIDTHTHLLLQPDDTSPPVATRKTIPMRTIEGVAAARVALRLGFTTVRDVDNEGARHADTALRDAIAGGIVQGPRMLVASDAITISGGAMTYGSGMNAELDLPAKAAVADTPEAMVSEVRRQ